MTPMEWRERDARTVAEAKATGTVQPFERSISAGMVAAFCLIGVTAFDDKRDQGALRAGLTERSAL
jgi:hypothetical protein